MALRVIKVPVEITVWIEGKVSVDAVRDLLRGVKWEGEHVTVQGRVAADLPAPQRVLIRRAMKTTTEG